MRQRESGPAGGQRPGHRGPAIAPDRADNAANRAKDAIERAETAQIEWFWARSRDSGTVGDGKGTVGDPKGTVGGIFGTLAVRSAGVGVYQHLYGLDGAAVTVELE